MKKAILKTIVLLGKLVSSMALVAAVGSVGSMCWFMTYQPDVPDELMCRE